MASLPELAAAWVASAPRGPTAPLLAALKKAAAGGKENGAKARRDAALQCFKACQAALGAPGAAGDAAAAAAAVGSAALAALAATSPPSAAAQLAGWRYNFARRLVACKAFGAAHAEAALLFAALRDRPSAGGEAASLAVGTALTLVLCCVEGKLLDNAAAVAALVDAACALPRWLSQLPTEEAGRHGEAAFKYLYKAAVTLLEHQAWQQLAAVCGAMLAAGGGDAVAQRRAVAAVARLRAATGNDQLRSLQPAARMLLSWDLQSYCARSCELPPSSAPVEQQELSWLASALFNVGVDLHGRGQYAAAAAAMEASLAPAVASLRALAEGGSSTTEVLEGRMADLCRKCIALADAQQQAGDCSGALSSLGHSTALLLQLGFGDPAAWRPLVQAFVRLQAELPTPAAEPAAPATQPARRGRGGASKKAAAAATAEPASSSSNRGSSPMLVECLAPHAEQLPEAVLFHAEEGTSGSSSSSSSSATVGWWRLTVAYLGSLLQLGQLFEAAGLADEALHALREAQRLAVAAGASPVAALCGARLADIYCRQGQLAAAQQAVAGAEQQLNALEAAAGSASTAQLYCQSAVLVARAQLDCSTGGSGSKQLSASLSQHPIRALQLDDDADPGEAVSSVQGVLEEMAGVLADSGRSMRELATDTKEQQREWWRARLALEDRLAALVRHLDSSWLGPWRCLLLGEPLASSSPAGDAFAGRLLELLEAAGQPASPQQAAVLHHAAAVLACHARRAASSGEAGMSPSELRQAVHQLCSTAGLACSQDQQHELEALLSAAAPLERAAAAAVAAAADADMPHASASTAAAPAKASKGRRAGGKSVKFADDVEVEQQQQPEPPAPAARAASKSRTPAASRGRRGTAAAAVVAAEQAAADSGGGGDTSPVATLGSLDGSVADEAPQTVAQSGLCQVFDSLNLEDAPTGTAAAAASGTAAKAAGATTARGGKHRSRLRMMQAGTPGPATARKSAAAAAATAPRPARELPLTVAKSAPPAAARPGSGDADGAAAAEAAAPVLLVLDGALQALPWESAPGLLRQRMYRMPSLICAAASAHRASTCVDLSSTFYALNPSGDLADTQSAFQDWFGGMRGWQGKVGCAPTAAELADALTSRQLFLYCGHGGGEQYISAAKLRSLERCSAALLMGCSSGRLRTQRTYEPSGAVLAYLLAGCPAAVANLWDVTDRDIDRFSQAVLTAWISGAGREGGEGSSGSSSGGGGGGGSAGTDVCAAVAASRGACKLPHLVGAAPVCYGIPSRIVASKG
ncbi:Regulator of spindle pole body duplication [Chlorella sorokiniana]|uniref:separase n=1 Tax=Chlorella sorokiniana TaxID=3076 RepID=A0A2P6TVD9_CHLSO|nr:Regulator of spindle pole body duplication [Chlorella sorokiniana]|eukprot:PRW58029.1 Regulator of spindle pole body duplication [Chlorella sorokiniana]